ncbi:hypothetical protein K440DRAFT_616646 [Wilcoxina mikolae CBS 423.85]|nr:hypothetical protein K440DRAFT_616646 [Wilcoxina mikolae CBS 423.85]
MSSPIDAFFRTFADFPYKPQNRATSEFQRLAEHRGWSKGEKVYRKARGRFLDAFEKEFNTTFQDWSYLCEVLDIDAPGSKTQARKAVSL